MRFMNSILTAVIVVIFSSIVASAAHAQNVVVVDTTKVLRDSLAGQDLRNKVKAIGDAMQTELTPEGTALENEQKSLDAKLAGKTQEQIRADASLVSQGQAFARKLQTYRIKSDKRARELVATERQALALFAQKMAEAVDAVRKERGAMIVLAKSDIYIADQTVEITDAVVQRLNQTTPTIAVTRVNLPDQQQPAQQ